MQATKIPVYLNVYDLHQANAYVFPVGLGAYHTGVQINGKEYAFGGHAYSFTGVFDIEPRTACGAIFRESILLGETTLSRAEIQRIIDELSDDYTGTSYHPFSRNCNSFSNELCTRLLKKPIPGYINRLPYLGSVFSCMIPSAGLQWLGLSLPVSLSSSRSSPTMSGSPRSDMTPLSPRPEFVAFSGAGSPLLAEMKLNAEEIETPETDQARREKLASAAYKRGFLNSSKEDI